MQPATSMDKSTVQETSGLRNLFSKFYCGDLGHIECDVDMQGVCHRDHMQMDAINFSWSVASELSLRLYVVTDSTY